MRQRRAAAIGSRELFGEAAEELALVEQAGQAVADGRLPQRLLGVFDAHGHVVEGPAQVVDLVAFDRRDGDPALQIAGSDGPRRAGQRAQRPHELIGENDADQHRHRQRPQSREHRAAHEVVLSGDDRRARSRRRPCSPGRRSAAAPHGRHCNPGPLRLHATGPRTVSMFATSGRIARSLTATTRRPRTKAICRARGPFHLCGEAAVDRLADDHRAVARRACRSADDRRRGHQPQSAVPGDPLRPRRAARGSADDRRRQDGRRERRRARQRHAASVEHRHEVGAMSAHQVVDHLFAQPRRRRGSTTCGTTTGRGGVDRQQLERPRDGRPARRRRRVRWSAVREASSRPRLPIVAW